MRLRHCELRFLDFDAPSLIRCSLGEPHVAVRRPPSQSKPRNPMPSRILLLCIGVVSIKWCRANKRNHFKQLSSSAQMSRRQLICTGWPAPREVAAPTVLTFERILTPLTILYPSERSRSLEFCSSDPQLQDNAPATLRLRFSVPRCEAVNVVTSKH